MHPIASAPPCPVCKQPSAWHDVVDFNRACLDSSIRPLPLSGMPVYYALCPSCGFCFAPTLHGWGEQEFAHWIYNDGYIRVDPGFREERPRQNAALMAAFFPELLGGSVSHLDYGGGEGLLAQELQAKGAHSISFDPYHHTRNTDCLKQTYQLVTAFEVLEHVPNVREVFQQLASLVADDGLLLVSTLLSDSHIVPNTRMNWWYAAPRNGHISLYSRKALQTCMQQAGLQCWSLNEGMHFAVRVKAEWPQHFLNRLNQASPNSALRTEKELP